MRGDRLKCLVSSLILLVISVLLMMFLSYADTHKYEPRFDWVSSSTMQPLAFVAFSAFAGGIVLAVAGVARKQTK